MNKLTRKLKVVDMRSGGFYGTKARWWLDTIQHDERRDTTFTKKQKKWAYKNGFIPMVAQRYGVTDENVGEFISIKDYCSIYPVNDIFRKWTKDRVTTRMVLKPYKEYLPELYFHIYKRDMEPMIIRLADCPAELPESFDGILQLIREKGIVDLAKTTGFVNHVIRYDGENYYYDGKIMTDEQILVRIARAMKKNICVVMEHVEDHEQLNNGKEGKPTVLRLMVYNKYADNPKIGQAYLRFYSASTMAEGEIDELGERVGDNIQAFDKINDIDEVEGENVEDELDFSQETDNDEQREIEVDDGVYEKNFMEDEIMVPKRGKSRQASRNIYVPVDLTTGQYDGGKKLDENNQIIEVSACEITGRELKGFVPGWDKIQEQIVSICHYLPQLEFFGVDIVITEDGFKIVDMTDHPYYPQVLGFNEEMTDYLRLKVSQAQAKAKDKKFRRKNFWSKANTYYWTRLTKLLCPPNMRPLIYKWWYVTVKADLFSRNGLSLGKKLWAYKRGFLSYRLPQYGITEENYKDFISDYDYRYLRHINNKYRVWLEDKITVKYICDKYSQFFPKYYYHISVRNGEKRVIPLMDLPDYCDNNLESVFKLVENVGALACKPQRGSQGQGFYKFSYSDGKYYLNHEEATKEQVLEILNDADAQYLVTEYIQQHSVIDKIYPGAVNTLRIITFMKDGKTAEIGNAYMRFGSKATGAVDNMGAGGMFVQVDMETGRFYNGKIITENSILPCSNHPDTGELIEGYLPNWDIVKQGVIDLCNEMPQLEYLGFDVAITEDGMKLPEINRAPGYPKIETFNRSTIDYLLYKRDVKMRKNKIAKTKW